MRKTTVTKAIMLHGRNYGEADRIMVAFTKERGRVDFLARGVRKIKSKNRAIIQSLTYSDVELIESERGLALLTQGVLIDSFVRLHRDFDRYAYASFLGEFLMQVLPEKVPDPELCYLFLHTLNHLDKRETPPDVVAWAFVLQALTHLGFRLALDGCDQCGVPGADAGVVLWASFEDGTLVCDRCGRPPGGYRLTPDLLAACLALETMDMRGPAGPDLSGKMDGVEAFAGRMLEYVLERRQKSARFIRKLKEMRNPTC